MSLLLSHPAVAHVGCELCQRLMFDPQNGTFHRDHAGKLIERPKGSPTPCQVCPKVAGLATENQNPREGSKCDLSDKNRRTLDLFHQNKAAPFEAARIDSVTRRNFGIIQQLQDEFDRQQARHAGTLLQILRARVR